MRPTTTREKIKITAGAIAALVMTGFLFTIALSLVLPLAITPRADRPHMPEPIARLLRS